MLFYIGVLLFLCMEICGFVCNVAPYLLPFLFYVVEALCSKVIPSRQIHFQGHTSSSAQQVTGMVWPLVSVAHSGQACC